MATRVRDSMAALRLRHVSLLVHPTIGVEFESKVGGDESSLVLAHWTPAIDRQLARELCQVRDEVPVLALGREDPLRQGRTVRSVRHGASP
jgi:hypothetical protein